MNLKKIVAFVVFLIAAFAIIATFAFAQGAGGQKEISLGQYALPVILMVVLSLIYKMIGQDGDDPNLISNRAKPLIAILIGVGLGIVGMFYNGLAATFNNIVDSTLYGFMTGCSAVGLWEGFKATAKK